MAWLLIGWLVVPGWFCAARNDHGEAIPRILLSAKRTWEQWPALQPLWNFGQKASIIKFLSLRSNSAARHFVCKTWSGEFIVLTRMIHDRKGNGAVQCMDATFRIGHCYRVRTLDVVLYIPSQT